MTRERFPFHNGVMPCKIYQIRNAAWKLVAEVAAESAAEAMQIAKTHWPEARTAHIKNHAIKK